MNSKGLFFTKDWTLFLDRDGVISERLPGDYVRKWEDFRFIGGVFESLRMFSGIFGRIIIISNQQGVGKGLMTAQELHEIDREMKLEIGNSGGRIDAAFYCTSLASENNPDRKPGVGMGLKAKALYPEIDFSKSVMVGDSDSDMEFGKKLGMVTVYIGSDKNCLENADYVFDSMFSFAQSINESHHREHRFTQS
ncbi:MAG: HAD-IIIA family hydrolase [Bacteroidales bacterium]|nr:HAD-IIIA family hydrolase [Bacteroidales bacterium]